MISQKLETVHVTIAIAGETGVGKSAVIRAFSEGRFEDDATPVDPVTHKVHYEDGTRYMFKLVEVGDWEARCSDLQGLHAFALLTDDTSTEARDRLVDKWLPRMSAPVFLVRSKSDLAEEEGEIADMARAVSAKRHFVCSAKQMNGICFLFVEMLRELGVKRAPPSAPSPLVGVKQAVKQAAETNSDSSSTCAVNTAAIGAVATGVGAVATQAYSNAREILMNPDAFPDVKQTIRGYVPCLFSTMPKYSRRSDKENQD